MFCLSFEEEGGRGGGGGGRATRRLVASLVYSSSLQSGTALPLRLPYGVVSAGGVERRVGGKPLEVRPGEKRGVQRSDDEGTLQYTLQYSTVLILCE